MTMAYTDDEIRRQLRLGEDSAWEFKSVDFRNNAGFDEQTVAGTGFSTLDKELWKPLLSAEGLRDPQLGLEKLGLLRTDGHGVVLATVAGILTCTREPREFIPGAEVTAVRYKGVDRASGQVDAQDIAGPINEQITQALAFVVRNMRVGARKDPARVNLPEYSSRAVFEALVNAVVHRDYSIQGSRIRLSVFSDRLELRSPGGLPNNLTVESMMERQVTRNQVLASILGRMSVGKVEGAGGRQYFMERRGDGVSIISSETSELSGKDAQFRTIDDSELCLTLPAAEVHADPATVVVTVRSGGSPLSGADVLALFPNNTWKRNRTDTEGEARLDLHSVHLPMTVFVAREGCAAHVERGWLPMERALAVELAPKAGGQFGRVRRVYRSPARSCRPAQPDPRHQPQDVPLCLQHRHQRRTAAAGLLRSGRGGSALDGRRRQVVARAGHSHCRTVVGPRLRPRLRARPRWRLADRVGGVRCEAGRFRWEGAFLGSVGGLVAATRLLTKSLIS